MAIVNPDGVSPGTFVIHDSVRPPLPAGDYTLTVRQAIDVTSGSATIPSIDPASWDFKIVGPRFTLPKDQQLSVFPPPDSSGAYADRLPQIVLQRRTLPYERRIVLTDNPSTTPPWLALVVLAEGEGQLVTNQPVDTAGLPDPGDQDATVQDVLRVSQTVVQAVFPTLTDLPWLTHVREVDMSDTELALGSDGWMSVVVANRLPVPGPPATPGGPATPRRYGAFLISLEGHANDLPTVETPANMFGILRVYDDTTIALGVQTAVAAQALPMESIVAAQSLMTTATAAASTTTAARFGEVSAAFTGRALTAAQPSQPVDAWSSSVGHGTLSVAASTTPSRAFLSGAAAIAGFALSPEFLEPAVPILSFTVLANWSFTSEPEGDFRYLMQHLDLGMLGTPPPAPPAASPGAPPPAPDPRTPLTVVDTGHLAIQGITRAGAQTTSWYRGPFTPRAITRPAVTDPGGVLAWASDQLRRVGPDGREEISLAVAYELGRTMAAAQPGLIAALLAWRSSGYSVSRVTALLAAGSSPLHLQLATVLAQKPSDFSAAVTAGLLSTLGATALGPVRPATTPPSVLPGGQSLSQAVSAGFGLDLTTVSALLGDPSTPTTVGLPAASTAPAAPQQLVALTAASFAAANSRAVTAVTGILHEVTVAPAALEPPVLLKPISLPMSTIGTLATTVHAVAEEPAATRVAAADVTSARTEEEA
jgi:hypothetical protein